MTIQQAADQALRRARLSGIPHHVLQNSQETWVAGQAAWNNFWPDLVPIISFDPRIRA